MVGGGSLADGSLIPTGDAVHQVVDINLDLPDRIENSMSTGCTKALVTCHRIGQLRDFEEGEQISHYEFEHLLNVVARELKEGWTPGKLGENITGIYEEFLARYYIDYLAGRGGYDTPFFNGEGFAKGNEVCITGYGCYDREEVNYFAQGMWSAAAGDTLEDSLELSETWNQNQYKHPATEGELYWTEFGYNWYMEWLNKP